MAKKDHARKALYMLRIEQNLTQDQFAKAIGYSRSQYVLVENGDRNASLAFWSRIQELFGVPDGEMFKLMKRG